MNRLLLSDQALHLIAARFRVLGEPMRLKLLIQLEAGERNVSQLVLATGATQANVSRHLQTLTEAGILGRRKDGLNVFYHIADPGIFDLCEQVCGSLQRKFGEQARAFSPAPPAAQPQPPSNPVLHPPPVPTRPRSRRTPSR